MKELTEFGVLTPTYIFQLTRMQFYISVPYIHKRTHTHITATKQNFKREGNHNKLA